MKKKMTLAIAVVVLLLGSFALASTVPQDELAPIWRGKWSTTWQYWYFDTDQTGQDLADGLTPDGPGPLIDDPIGTPYEQPGYLPSTHVVVYPDPEIWYEVDPAWDSGRIGIWPLSGWIDVVVDNHNPVNPYKWVYVQLTWAPELEDEPNVRPAFTNFNPDVDPNYPVRLVDEIDHGDGWKTSAYEWRISPNPPDEAFTIGFDNGSGLLVDKLVIDTWCMPEPATLLVLFLGLAPALLKRRRNTQRGK